MTFEYRYGDRCLRCHAETLEIVARTAREDAMEKRMMTI